MAYGADGLVIETHCIPKKGVGDDPKQAITPDVLTTLIAEARELNKRVRKFKSAQAA